MFHVEHIYEDDCQVRRMRCWEDGSGRVVLVPAGRRDRARSRWASPMSRARRPPGATRPAAASEGLFEVLDGAHGDQAGASLRERFGAGVEDGKAGEVEGAADLAQEGGFFAVALDEGELEVWAPNT